MAENLRNSQEDAPTGGAIDRNALSRYVERITALLDERDVLTSDIKEVYEEAKESGFVTKILRAIVRESRLEPEVRNDQYVLMTAYRSALGLLADTPLGEAAMRAAAKKPGRPRKKSTDGEVLH